MELPRYFSLRLRGALGTLIWLIPAMIIVAAFRNGETGLAGLVGFVSLVFLGISMLYLPMLQAHFAAENRFSALFEVRTIRSNFRSAPWAWLLAMVIALVVTPIPLYLLKIEATPREVMWLPCLVFIAFILPAHIATGLALRRARRSEQSTSRWARISRWLVFTSCHADRRCGLFAVRLRVSIHQLGRIADIGPTARHVPSRYRFSAAFNWTAPR